MSKVWFVTGTSTGFGRDLAELALETGNKVAATARKPETLAALTAKYGDNVLAVALDVTKPDTITAAVQAAKDKFGRIDVLVNNAGYAALGAFEEVTDAQLRAQFETNFFGALAVTRAVLPLLRAQGSGHILNVSSIGGLAAFPSLGTYCASKFALEAVSEALAVEVKPFGIHVTIVEPGAFRTAIIATGMTMGANRMPEYAAFTDGIEKAFKDMDGKQPGDPRRAAHAMIQITEAANPPLRLLLGGDALEAARKKLDTLKADFDTWEHITNSTNFPGETHTSIGA